MEKLFSSSSSRSSPSSSSSILHSQTPSRSTMEEVWKDIALTTLQQESPVTPPNQQNYHQHPAKLASFSGMILQDFLAGPLNRPLHVSPPGVEELPLTAPPPPSLPPPLTPTALSLNSGSELQCMSSDANTHSNSKFNGHNGAFISTAFSDAIDCPPSRTGLFSLCSKKRVPENTGTGGDSRHKRMIKNRESAARSRTRKQAYTNELELKVAHLLEENAKLKQQHLELHLAIAAQLPKRNTVQRSLTAPF